MELFLDGCIVQEASRFYRLAFLLLAVDSDQGSYRSGLQTVTALELRSLEHCTGPASDYLQDIELGVPIQ